ncbi:MAG: hypothetical protein MUF49_09230 [Oculatellaceae cyanobacterium Prado106]|jgi:hypothetical protein|nr:hypothetical protein [Oculatellaceae cyanobacterium Prado106]
MRGETLSHSLQGMQNSGNGRSALLVQAIKLLDCLERKKVTGAANFFVARSILGKYVRSGKRVSKKPPYLCPIFSENCPDGSH